jgi:hypothetical protein
MNNIKYTIGYIDHNKEVFENFLGKSLNNLEGNFKILKTSDVNCPSKNYNEMLFKCNTQYLILTHQDIEFSKNLLFNIDKTIEKLNNNFGALCLVGVDEKNNYLWANTDEIYSVQTSDCCFLVIDTKNDIKFDEILFDDFHLYVEDYCAQLLLQNKKTYTILTSSNINYNENSYILHHSATLSKKGACWGKYKEYKRIFNTKWPGVKTT